MQKPETKFRTKFVKRLDQVPNSWWESIQQKTIRGTPDIIGCVGGLFVGLELKATPGSMITPLQEEKLKRIAAAGGIGIRVDPSNADESIELLIEFSKLEENSVKAKLEADQQQRTGRGGIQPRKQQKLGGYH